MYTEETNVEFQVETPEQAQLPVQRMALDTSFKRYYSEGKVIDAKDIVVAVREKYPHPRQKVIIETNLDLPVQELEGLHIYVAGKNEDAVSSLRGIDESGYCPVRIVPGASEDGGLYDTIRKFIDVYDVYSFEILLYGDDEAALLSVWEFIQNDDNSLPYRIYLPHAVVHSLKLLSNGFDLAEVSEKMRALADTSKLNCANICKILDEVGEAIKSGKTALQCLRDSRDTYVKWLTLCLTSEHNLAPAYLDSYFSEYVKFEIAYPMSRLSFIERLSFMMSLPKHVGYIGSNDDFRCLAEVSSKVYPNPMLAYNMESGEVITDDLSDFRLPDVQILDTRKLFKNSSRAILNEAVTPGLSLSTFQDDVAADEMLKQSFAAMCEASTDIAICPSVRNTAIIRARGTTWLVYYGEPFGVVLTLTSDLFGKHAYVVSEENFHHLIDYKVVIALQERQKQPSREQGLEVYSQIMTQGASTFKTAIPARLLMCASLGGHSAWDLSYYDRRLRCDKVIMPIVTHVDSELRNFDSPFKHLNLKAAYKDEITKAALTSFGTVNFDAGYGNKLPVTIESFKGWNLLDEQ